MNENKDDTDVAKNVFKGVYVGTTIDGKWWKRYTRDGFFMRGAGLGEVRNDGFYFRRYLIKKPLFILYSDMIGISLGDWHGGKWAAGRLILKIEWKKEGKEDKKLCSGFLFEDDDNTRKVNEYIEKKWKARGNGRETK
ncbi:MAG: hypothetical protein QXT63_01935 [Thermoplasmata archaeon]